MLPDLLAPFLADAAPDLWMTYQHDGRAVGLCYCAPEPLTDGTWNMRALAVLPAVQGRRMGGGLVAATEQELRRRGVRLLIVDTSGTDAFALTRKFYASNGYAEVSRIADYWAPGDDKVTFRKAL